MRIAVSADSKDGLDSAVSPHFGRCAAFVLVDVEGDQVTTVTSIDNPYFHGHQPGQVPQFISEQGVHVMLTGGMGGRAVQFFDQANVEAVTGASGTVGDSIDSYLSGALTGSAPCAHDDGH